MSAWVVISVYGNYLEFIGVYFNFLLFFKSVDVVDGSLCVKGALIRIESVGDNLGDVVSVYNVACVDCLLVGKGRCRWCNN